MIYTQQGVRNSNLTLLNTENSFLWVCNTKPITYPYNKNKEHIKKNEALYFISGEIKANEDNTYTRNDRNLINRDLILIDYDNINIPEKEFLSLVYSVLGEYDYCLYQTISHTTDKPRYRLVVKPNRPLLKKEYKPNILHIVNMIGLECDTSSSTWSQLQGQPIHADNQEDYIFIKNQTGKPFEVIKVQEKPKKKSEKTIIKTIKKDDVIEHNIVEEDNKINEYLKSYIGTDYEIYLNIFIKYCEADKKNLQDYNNALSLIILLAREVVSNEIPYDLALICCEIMAFNNIEWEKGNIEKLNAEITASNNDIEYFRSTYTSLIEKVKATKNKNLIYYSNYLLGNEPTCNSELKWRLFQIGKQWREDNTEIKNDGTIKIPIMPFNTISKYLKNNIPMKLTGYEEDKSIIYCYDYDKGIYTGSELYIDILLTQLEERFNPMKYSQVHKCLKTIVPFTQKLTTPDLIAVNNGIFNLKTKEFKPFSPKYFITSKLSTNYNNLAINNYIALNTREGIYFDVDNWFRSIANNDEEIVLILWEMINEAINPNHTRDKIGIMLGEGNNGKGTFQALLMNLIGKDNVATLKPPQFASRFELSQLLGKVCNIGDDISSKYLDDISNLMSIATGESITIDRKNQPPISAVLKTFLLFSANELPKIRNKTQGAYRRLLIVPFNADFNGQVQNRKIKNEYIKNKTVLEYILYKAINMSFESFSEAEAVEKQLAEYKEINDYILAFINDWYIPNRIHEIERVPIPYIKMEFKKYCDENFLESKITGAFGNTVAKHLSSIFKDKSIKYINVKKKLTSEDKNHLKKLIHEFYYKDYIKDYSLHCIMCVTKT